MTVSVLGSGEKHYWATGFVTKMMKQNPYESPACDAGPTKSVAKCPACTHPIGFRKVASAAFPLFLNCDRCNARLLGGTFVRIQAVLILVAPPLAAAAMLLRSRPWSYKALVLVCLYTLLITLVLAVANVPATVYFGRYELRDQDQSTDERGQADFGREVG